MSIIAAILENILTSSTAIGVTLVIVSFVLLIRILDKKARSDTPKLVNEEGQEQRDHKITIIIDGSPIPITTKQEAEAALQLVVAILERPDPG